VSYSCVVGGSADAAFGCQYYGDLLTVDDIDKAQDCRDGCSRAAVTVTSTLCRVYPQHGGRIYTSLFA